jgi:type I restriction enzyme S subunit
MNAVQQLLTDHIDIWTAAETEKKSGRGRVSSNAANVYGVKKLRKLIRELAVRGKLVSQDTNDEPASDLLSRLHAEKTQLIAEGRTKLGKPQPIISSDEKPYSLPAGWKWIRLNDFVLRIISGGTPSKNVSEFWNGDIPWASVKDLNVERFLETTEDHITKAGLEAGSKLASKGDLLICTRMGLGKVAIAAVDVAINQDLKALKLSSLIDINYFINFYSTLKIIGSGMTVAGIKQDELLGYCIPTPPLEEQRRIVAKIDELMTLCDRLEAQHGDAADAHEKLVSHLLGTLTQSQSAADFNTNWQRIASHFDTLFTTEASIDALKQTLLQLAVMGKLVAQDANDEPASQLLKHIQAEKAKLIAEGKIKKDRLFVPSVERENPYTIPRSWKWVTLDEISQVGTGATPLRTTFEYYNPPSISWVTSGETSHSFISETEQYVSALALQETNLTVYPRGTLIVAMYGQGKTRGQITELMIEACTNQACAAIQLYSDIESHRKYVKLFFEKIYDEIRELAAGGAQPNLNLSKIKETLLPLPPLSEQYRIVVKIDELMNICDRLRLCITYAKQQQQKLADVLVAHAVM